MHSTCSSAPQSRRLYLLHLAIALILFLPLTSHGQNLVINGGFETPVTGTCPNSNPYPPFELPFSNYVTSWVTGNPLTPDYFRQCTVPPASPCRFYVPSNEQGYENPVETSGIAYAGIALGDHDGGVQYREYLLGRLSTPLAASTTYRVQFRASLAEVSGIAQGKLGVLLGQNLTATALPVYPTAAGTIFYENPTVITKYNGWDYVAYTFTTAAGGENSLVIGCFEQIVSSTTVTPPIAGCVLSTLNQSHDSYYYIDDVRIECVSSICQHTSAQYTEVTAENARRDAEGNCVFDLYVERHTPGDPCPVEFDSFDFTFPDPIIAFTVASGWSKTAVGTTGYTVKGPLSKRNQLVNNTPTYVGTITVAPNGGTLQIVAHSDLMACNLPSAYLTCAECDCGNLSVAFVYNASASSAEYCVWDVKVTQTPSPNCAAGVNISGITVLSETAGSTELDLSSGMILGQVRGYNPPGPYNGTSYYVTVEILDAFGGVLCTKYKNLGCGEEPDWTSADRPRNR